MSDAHKKRLFPPPAATGPLRAVALAGATNTAAVFPPRGLQTLASASLLRPGSPHLEPAARAARHRPPPALPCSGQDPARNPWFLAMIPGGSPATGGSGAPPPPPPSVPASSAAPGRAGGAFSLFHTNPSLGLFLFSPLVPAADNRPALALLTTVQLLLGLSWMTRRASRAGESRARARAVAALRFSAGSVAVFLAAFEALRLAIPYDPWAEEARAWRHWAVRNGHGPSWWRGAIAFYTPMPVAEWKRKTTNWLSNLINALEADRAADAGAHDADVLSSIPLGPRAVLKAGEADTYTEIYESLCAKNGSRAHALLAGALADVSELNKAARLDALLEDEGHVHLDADYSRPNIQLGTHTMDTDADFEMVWANFEPWDELFQETDFDVRMIPRWRCVDGLSDGPSDGPSDGLSDEPPAAESS